MENYSEYNTEDFLADENFRDWMRAGGTENSSYMEDFKKRFPAKINELLLARSLYHTLHQLQAVPEAGIKSRIWNNVESAVSNDEPEDNSFNVVRSLQRWWWIAAASVMLVGGLSWKLLSTFSDIPLVYKKQVVASRVPLQEKGNLQTTEQIIRLSDGSVVKLKPGSKLSYSDFSGNQRVVYLDGEGYFDVAKNGAKPFVVYAGPIVVQVVGTSFNVSSHTGKTISNVSVLSGRVKVFATEKINESDSEMEAQAVYLTPNQQVVFDASKSVFEKGLVAEPVQLRRTGDAKEFYFTNTAVNDILGELETAYGVTMRYNNSSFATCKVTAPLGDLPLFRKLDIICQTLGATYEVFGTEIVITGGSCDL